MTLSADDRAAITELISLHGHLFDEGEFDRLDELFTPDVVYDATDYGVGSLEGVAAILDAALTLGARNPVAHHVTNVVLTELADGKVRARSKGIAIMAGGTCGSATYDDVISYGDQGWRISHRKIIARRAPLGGLGSDGGQ
ncbi:nuclear transport factor 2 family protein [Nonomuraea sp. NPDC049129]|uniref:nuclear transport factor 2 family protein n=1 Tax=Nonomuraea sp. NPDC049129 TaxID=3155272 RepID=UPI0033C59E25